MNLTNIKIDQLELPAATYAPMTYPRFREFLNGEKTPDDVIAVGVTCGDVEVGLALLSQAYEDKTDDAKTRRLLSIMVASRFRGKGIGEQLLKACEQLVFEMGTQKLVAFHSDQMAHITSYEKLLDKCHWMKPQLHEFRQTGRADWAIEAKNQWRSLFSRMKRNGYTVVPWQQLDEANRLIATQMSEQIPNLWFQPFNDEEPDQPDLSIGICQNDKLVGWIMGDWVAEDNTARYTNGYVLPEYQRNGWMIAGMIEVCKRQCEIYGADSLSVFETSGSNDAMQNFMKRRLKDQWVIGADHRFVSHKNLGKESTD